MQTPAGLELGQQTHEILQVWQHEEPEALQYKAMESNVMIS